MDSVSKELKSDHTSLAEPVPSDPITATATATVPSTSTTGNHVNQAMNGGGEDVLRKPRPNTGNSASKRSPLLSGKDSSQYQLVFIDDTSSEASLTDSPLLHDPFNRALQQHFSSTQQNSSLEDSQASAESDVPADTDTNMDANTDANLASSGVSAAELMSARSAAEDVRKAASPPHSDADTLDQAESAPIRGEVAGTTCTSGADETLDSCHHEKLTSNGKSFPDSQNSSNKELEGSGNLNSPPREQGIMSSSPEPNLKLNEFSTLRSRSTSSEEVGQKSHPLSFLTSDSDLAATPTPPPPPYSPIPNTSGKIIIDLISLLNTDESNNGI